MELNVAIKLLAALVIGAVIGLERTYHGRAAGFRTLGLVCLGSALLMTYAVWQVRLAPPGISGDALAGPQRVVQGVMTGIGFLGGGVIFRQGLTVRGLTTAATVWVTAALGLLIGAGFWSAVGISLVAILFTLSVLRWAEDHMPRQRFVDLALKFICEQAPGPDEIRALLHRQGFRTVRMTQGLNAVTGLVEYHLAASTLSVAATDALAAQLRSLPSLKGFELAPTDE